MDGYRLFLICTNKNPGWRCLQRISLHQEGKQNNARARALLASPTWNSCCSITQLNGHVKPQNIFKREFLGTERGLKYFHCWTFLPGQAGWVECTETSRTNTRLLLHTTCLRRCQSICSPHWGCSGNLQLLRAQIWLTKFTGHSEGRAFFFVHGRDFLLQRSVTKSCFWTHGSCSWCDHTLPKACLNTALPSSP